MGVVHIGLLLGSLKLYLDCLGAHVKSCTSISIIEKKKKMMELILIGHGWSENCSHYTIQS